MEKTEIVVERRPASSLALFAAKAVMVGIVAVISLLVVGNIFADKIASLVDERMLTIERRINAMMPTQVGGTGIVAIVERELERAASPRADLPPEVRQKIISDLRIVADKWRPFFVEASAAIIGPSSPSAVK